MEPLRVEPIVSPPLATNAYLVVHEASGKALCIDPACVGAQIVEKCRVNSWSLEAVVLTHGHIDHTSDAAHLANEREIPVWAHREAEPFLIDSDKSGADWLGFAFEPIPVSRWLDDGEKLSLGEAEVLEVFYAPGHSPGSICLVGKGICLTGDLLFAGGIGRWDLPGGDLEVLRSSLTRLVERCDKDATLYPGHGESTTMAKERKTNPYLLNWV